MRPHYLSRLFAPEAVAVIGASEREGSVGGRVLRNLLDAGFGGRAFPVNPAHESVLGLPCHARIEDVEARPDVAVIATPAATVPDLVGACGARGVAAVVVMSAGFGEAGPEGRAREERLRAQARAHGVRVLGPNCLGLMRPSRAFNATFSNNSAEPGRLGLVSQSGALCTAILDWAAPRHIGFSAVVSLGDAADLDFGDIVDYLALDHETSSILLYVEGVHQPRRFLSALRSAARIKPVIVIKAGRQEAGSRAAMSHTGALVGGDDAFDAALRRAGAVRVDSLDRLFSAAQILAEHPGDAGDRLAIVTNAGGPGVLAADRAADLGLELPPPDADTLARLDRTLPAAWSRSNPIDLLGDAPPGRYADAVEACLGAPEFDGVLAILTPQAMSQPEAAAEVVVAAGARSAKPLLASWMGGAQVAGARRRFFDARLPHFGSPEAAVEAFSCLVQRRRNRELLLQVPGPRARRAEPDAGRARRVIEDALAEDRRVLTGTEAKAVLAAFGIPVIEAAAASSEDEAAARARALGFPLAMKIDSPDVAHKSDVDGVRLDLADEDAVRRAWREILEAIAIRQPRARVHGVLLEPMYAGAHARELLLGVARDPVFGPVISFGAGGTAVEIVRDRAVALPPLNAFLADRLIDDTRIARMLGDWRNLPAADRTAVQQALVSVSELVCELAHVVELDINPLMASPEGIAVVDARIGIEPPAPASLPYGHMAIHPYPVHRRDRFRAPNGTTIEIRAIRPEDAEMEQAFVRGLSERTRYLRFMASMRELTREMLVRFTQIDYDREMALVAVTGGDGRELQVGVARYTVAPDGESCEFAIVVAEAWHDIGLGRRLMEDLIEAARDRGLKVMEGETLANNEGMLGLAERLGFAIRASDDDPGTRIMHLDL